MQFSTPNPKFFEVELLPSDMIYTTRRGERTDEGLEVAIARGREIAAYLRKQNKPVLILNDTHLSNAGPRVTELLMDFDYDRWALYGASKRYNNLVELRLRANGLDHKIRLFQTREEAVAWLQAFKPR